MAKLFNNPPFGVVTPSASDMKQYTHSQAQWNGIVDNKNVATVDQNSFSECNNVYVDYDNVLRSRPAIKIDHVHVTINEQLVDVLPIKIFSFVNTFVYLVDSSLLPLLPAEIYGDYALIFTNVNNEFLNYTFTKTTDCCVFRQDNYIYVFDRHNIEGDENCAGFMSFNTNTSEIYPAYGVVPSADRIYVPEIAAHGGAEPVAVEDKNILTSRVKEAYLLSKASTDFSTLIGKVVTVKVNGEEYTALFDENTPTVLVDTFTQFNDNFLYNDKFHIWTGKDGRTLMQNTNTTHLYYSQNGKEFTDQGAHSMITGIKDIGYMSDNTFNYGEYCYRTGDSHIRDLHIEGSSFYYASFYILHNGQEYRGHIDISNPSYPQLYDYIYQAGDQLYGIYVIDLQAYGDGHIDDITFYIKRGNTVLSYVVDASHERSHFLHSVTIPQLVYCDCNNTIGHMFKYYYSDGTTLYSNTIRGSDAAFILQTVIANVDGATQFVCQNSMILTDKYLFKDNTKIPLVVVKNNTAFQPLFAGSTEIRYVSKLHDYDSSNSYVMSSNFTEISAYVNSGNPVWNDFVPQVSCNLDNWYFAVDNKLYITEPRYDDNNDILLYIPERNVQSFNSEILGVMPISTTEVAVFLQDEIWYVTRTDQGYEYYRSKIDIRINKGTNFITSYDGTEIIFATDQGLVSLSYQNFVATTDQKLKFLSENILQLYRKIFNFGLKICKFDFWIILYSPNNQIHLLYDTRNTSWWKIQTPDDSGLKTVTVVNNELKLLFDYSSTKRMCKLQHTTDSYYDEIYGDGQPINWLMQSQMLHLDTLDYFKHLKSIMLYTAYDNELLKFDMEVRVYRNTSEDSQMQSDWYNVYKVRSFVKRMNIFKVSNMRYTLTNTPGELTEQYPLCLSGLFIKYLLGGRVR